jgi:hypothetical protein
MIRTETAAYSSFVHLFAEILEEERLVSGFDLVPFSFPSI